MNTTETESNVLTQKYDEVDKYLEEWQMPHIERECPSCHAKGYTNFGTQHHKCQECFGIGYIVD